MAQKNQYTIIAETDYAILVSKVQQYVEQGYEPVGGVAVDSASDGRNTFKFFQALFRKR